MSIPCQVWLQSHTPRSLKDLPSRQQEDRRRALARRKRKMLEVVPGD